VNNFNDRVNFIWSVADLLRGPYRPNQYKDVMLPMVVLRRMDCVLEPTKQTVLDRMKALKGSKIENLEPILNREAGQNFHNTSRFTFEKLKGDPSNIADNLLQYIKSFSTRARDILEHFKFEEQIVTLEKADRLYLLVSKFAEIDLHPEVVSNIEMGYIFEELIRRFNEASNEEAGDHFTPREVIRLMVNLIFAPDNEVLTRKGIVKTLFDPAAGTGGMLSVSEDYLRELNPDADLEVFGQDYNPQSYAICGSDMMIKGQSLDNIRFGDSFTEDHHAGKRFDYMLANPPFGVKWESQAGKIKDEYEQHGFGGRFGAGLPRINDGSFLFLQHMVSKMKRPEDGGTRLAIVFNGSPLFIGGAGSGESEIRRWIIEHDWLDAIVALPDKLFYNTGISTYLWIVTNRKETNRKGLIQLIDASKEEFYKKMRWSLGKKRHRITSKQIDVITKLYGDFKEGEHVKIFPNDTFGYQRVTVERPLKLNFQVTDQRLARVKESKLFQALAKSKKRKDKVTASMEIEAGFKKQQQILKAISDIEPLGLVKDRDQFSQALNQSFQSAKLKLTSPLIKSLLIALSERDETAEICRDAQRNPEPDTEMRDHENVPLNESIQPFMEREVLHHNSSVWVAESKTKIGYEINFTRHFYKYRSPRMLPTIETEIQQIEREIVEVLELRAQRIEVLHEAIHDEATENIRLEYITEQIKRPIIRAPDKIYTPIGLFNRGRGIFKKEETVGADLGDSDFFRIESNDLILSGQFAWEGAVALVSDDESGCVASHRFPILRCDPSSMENAYLFAFLTSQFGDFLLNEHSRGAAGRNRPLNIGNLLKEKIPVPPIQVQHRISELVYFERNFVKNIGSAIDLFREYRSSLVSDAVHEHFSAGERT